MKVVPFESWHLDLLKMQAAQDYISQWISADVKAMLGSTNAFTGIDEDRHEILACAGVLELWEGRGVAWAMLADGIGSRFVPIHKAVARYLEAASLRYRRLEATIDIGFSPGVRWVKLLGFKLETPLMEKYLPDGGDAAMYVRLT